MNTTIKILGFVGTMTLGLGLADAAQGKLDGKSYRVTITEPNQKTYADTLVFKAGSFDSSECRPYGFQAARYQADGASFTVTARSDKEGTARWSGSVKGDRVEGAMVWTKPGQAPLTYRFRGAASKK